MNKKSYNIVADIAGRHDELLELIAIMPPAARLISVGDVIDRGPKSRQVVEFFMSNPQHTVLQGNHEAMCVESYYYGQLDSRNAALWLCNGGEATLDSYNQLIPEFHLQWMRTRPLWVMTPDLFISHAPVNHRQAVPGKYADAPEFTWNRLVWPQRYKGRINVYGHNATTEPTITRDAAGSITGICIDLSKSRRLCGLHWDEETRDYTIYTVPYKE